VIFLEKAKKLITDLKNKIEISKRNKKDRIRRYVKSKLDHEWTVEELEEYNEWYMLKTRGKDGGHTAAEYQRMILNNCSKYLTKEEIAEITDDISRRSKKEKTLKKWFK